VGTDLGSVGDGRHWLLVSCEHYDDPAQFRAPTPTYAFVLGVVSGVLLATGRYAGGVIAGAIAVALLGLWKLAEERGDDDSHTLL
jgi:hypothetical protein